jgi:hypothetical protein
MMEDEKVAKFFLSTIIKEEVVELSFAAQERTRYLTEEEKKQKDQSRESNLTVCRLDFSAKIRTPDDRFKTVMIELQKIKLPSDIMRFRRYLGLNYMDPSNADQVNGEETARQIYCIFLLGHDLGFPQHPVIRVDHKVTDDTTDEDLSEANEFIRSIHHRSWIVQIPQLKRRRRNEVEQLLSVFDQDNRANDDHHIMNVNEDDFPEIYRPIIRRLRMASESKDIRLDMELEDDYIKDLQYLARQTERLEEKDKVIEEKDKALEENKKALEENKKALEEKDKALEEKDKALEENKKLIERLMKQLANK